MNTDRTGHFRRVGARPQHSSTLSQVVLLGLSAIFSLSCGGSHSAATDGGAADGNPPQDATTADPSLLNGKSWGQYQADREKAVDEYLQRRKVAYNWFVNRPLGVNGVPIGFLTFLMNKYPDIWQDKLGFPPHLDDYDDQRQLKDPASRRVLSLGFAWNKDFDETDATRQTNNVFFSCGGCHISRVLVNGAVRHFIGGPSNEVEPQRYAGLIWETGQRMIGEINLKQTDLTLGEQISQAWDATKLAALWVEFRVRRDLLKTKQLAAHLTGGGSPVGYQADGMPLDLVHEYDLLADNFDFFKTVVTNFVGSYIKANTLYKELGTRIPFRPADPNAIDPEGRKEPGVLFGPKPGQMDAFGLVQGIIVLNSIRPDGSWLKFSEDRYGSTSAFWLGAQGTGTTLYKDFQKRLAGSIFGLADRINLTDQQKAQDAVVAREWFSPNSANSDIKAIWLSGLEVNANWDGNQASVARALASGVSSVGDPRKVDTLLHSAMNPFIQDLPAPVWPFGVDIERATRGQALFLHGKGGGDACASCHFDNNPRVYNVGTDMNRSMVTSPAGRRFLKSLAMEACSLGMKRPGEDTDRMVDDVMIKRTWCDTTEANRDEEDIYRRIDTTQGSRVDYDQSTKADVTRPIGYKADPLYAIWASAPYLHNGSVPTLFALLKPAARPVMFYRGNINYDQHDVGYQYDQADATNYPDGESKHIAPFDTTLRGNSNAGHESFTVGWTDDELYSVIEYLKTL